MDRDRRKAACPQLVREDDDVGVGVSVGIVEHAPEERQRAHDVKEAARDARTFEALRLPRPRQIRGPVRELGHRLEAGVRALVVLEVGNRERRPVALGASVVHPDEAIGVAKRQRANAAPH